MNRRRVLSVSIRRGHRGISWTVPLPTRDELAGTFAVWLGIRVGRLIERRRK